MHPGSSYPHTSEFVFSKESFSSAAALPSFDSTASFATTASLREKTPPEVAVVAGPVSRRAALERRLRDEVDLFRLQYKSICLSFVWLIYGVLVVFLNLSFYRYAAPATSRLRDVGHELIPELPREYKWLPEMPLFALYTVVGAMAFFSLFVYNDKDSPYLVNVIRRFGIQYAIGHTLRASTYLTTTIPGGNDGCLSHEYVEANRPLTLRECFIRAASVDRNCGDEFFSGHVLLATLLILTTHRYARAAFRIGNAAFYALMGFCGLVWATLVYLILASRHHYTADIVAALYVTALLWLAFQQYDPVDLKPPSVAASEKAVAAALHSRSSSASSTASSNDTDAFFDKIP